MVLLGIQKLQQRRSRIALEAGSQLVDLIEKDDRVLGTGAPHSLHHPAGTGPHIGPPMAPNLGLVAYTA